MRLGLVRAPCGFGPLQGGTAGEPPGRKEREGVGRGPPQRRLLGFLRGGFLLRHLAEGRRGEGGDVRAQRQMYQELSRGEATVPGSGKLEAGLRGRAPEHFRVHQVAADGRCLFRALAVGLARASGVALSAGEEVAEADGLRALAAGALCGRQVRPEFSAALFSVRAEFGEDISGYCERVRSPSFWGGHAELIVLSRLLERSIVVYVPHREAGGSSAGFVPIVSLEPQHAGAGRGPMRLLYTNGNHYDLLC